MRKGLSEAATSPRPAILLKKRLWHRHFPVNFVKFLRTPFLQSTSGRLLLDFIPKARELLERMKQQGSKRGITGTSLRKIILAPPESFQQFSISCQDLLNVYSEDKLYNFSLSVCIYLCVYIIPIYKTLYVCVCV